MVVKELRSKFIIFGAILFALVFVIDYSFHKPTVVNKFIATRVMNAPAHSAFTDDNFYACVVDAYNNENDSSIAYSEMLSDEQLASIEYLYCSKKNVEDLSGLNLLTGLTNLNLSGNSFDSIDLSKNVSLISLDLGWICYSGDIGVSCWAGNSLTQIDLSKNVNLRDLYIPRNKLEHIDLSNNTKLENIGLESNKLKSVVLPETETGYEIDISNLLISGSEGIKADGENFFVNLTIDNNSIKKLTASSIGLQELIINNAPNLTSITATNYSSYSDTPINPNVIEKIELSNAKLLEEINLINNNLFEIDLSENSELKSVYLNYNKLSTIDITNLSKIEKVSINNNKLSTINLNNNENLKYLDVSNNQIESLDLNNINTMVDLNASNNNIKNLSLGNLDALKNIDVKNNQITSLNLYGATSLQKLIARNNALTQISLEDTSALYYLDVAINNLNSINLTGSNNLQTLDVYSNNLTDIDLSNNESLSYLNVSSNLLESIDVSQNTNLEDLRITNNKLTELKIENDKITNIDASGNSIVSLDIDKCANLKSLDLGLMCANDYGSQSCFDGNFLSELDVSKNTNLEKLYIPNNLLKTLDLSQNVNLKSLNVQDNPFESNVGIYVNDEVVINEFNPLKLLKASNSVILDFETNSDDIMFDADSAVVNSDDLGKYEVNVAYEHNIKSFYDTYNVKYNVYVIEATSNKYIIDEEDGYVYTGNDFDDETILSNINLNYGEAIIEDNQVKIVFEGEIIKSFDLINISSDTYDLSEEYIYLGDQEIDLTKIDYKNASAKAENNQLIISYNEDVLEVYNLINIYSEYVLEDDYIYVYYDSLDNLNLELINATYEVENNRLIIKYNGDVVVSYSLIGITSDIYDLNNEYLLVGQNELLESEFNIINGTLNITENDVTYEYNGDELDSWYISAFEDQAFYNCVIDEYNNTNKLELDYKIHLTDSELLKVGTMFSCYNKGIKSVEGIRKLVNVQQFLMSGNAISEIDVSMQTNLYRLTLSSNNLSNLDVTNNPNLTILEVSENNLTEINLTNNPKLWDVNLSNNNISSIDVSHNTKISDLSLENNKLTEIELSKNTSLKTLQLNSNYLSSVDLSKNTNLKKLYLRNNNILYLDLSNNIQLVSLFVSNNLLTNLDLTNNVLLEEVSVDNSFSNKSQNAIASLNLSNMNNLKYLNVEDNAFETNYAIYKGEKTNFSSDLISLPSHISLEYLDIVSESETIVLENNSIYARDIGKYNLSVSGTININDDLISYSGKHNIYVIEATSDKYLIDAEDGYIYTENDLDDETILNNINLNYGEATIEDDQLKIMFEGNVVKVFDIININSDYYDLNKNYIYLGNNEIDLTKLDCGKAEYKIENNQLVLGYNDDVLKTYDLVQISSDNYNLNKEYIYTKAESFDINNIDVINGNKEVNDNKLVISYEEEVLQTFDIVTLQSDVYDLSKEYIYLKNELPDINKISIINGTVNITNDYYFEIKYGEQVIDKKMIIMLTSEEYNLSNSYIILGNNVHFDQSKIEETNVYVKVIDEYQYSVGYDNGTSSIIIDTIDLVWYWSDNYNLDSDTLKINELTLEEFKNKIELYNAEIKLFNEEGTEVTSFGSNYQAKIMYEDLVLETYNLDYSVLGVELDKEVISLDLDIVNEIDLSYATIPVFANNQNVTWTSSNENVATVDENGIVKALSKGEAIITITTEEGNFTDKVIVNVTDIISSDTYNISIEDKYIYLGTESNEEEIVSNIIVSENLDIDIDLENNKLYILKDNEKVDTFALIRIDSETYDLTKNYMYVSNLEDSQISINVVNAEYIISDNKLIIQKGDITLQEFILVRATVEGHNIAAGYVYIANKNLDLSLIKITNGSYMIDNNQIKVKYNEEVLDTIDIIKLSSETYNLTKNYIYIGTGQLDLNKINVVNGTLNIKDNKLQVIKDNTLLEEWKLVSVSSDKYDLTKDYIYLPGVDIDLDKIKVVNGKVEISENTVDIKVEEDIVDSFTIAALVIYNPFEVKDEKILSIGKPTSYADFLEKITLINITYKIYDPDGNHVWTDITFDNGYKMEILYNNEVIGSLDIEAYYLNFDEDFQDTDRTFTTGLGFSVNDVLSKLDTNGTIKVVNNKGEVLEGPDKIGTKSKLSITFGEEVKEYTFVVTGDLTGDGEVKINDISKLYQSLKGKIALDEYDKTAGDVASGDSEIKINDVSKLYQFLKGKINKL